MIGTCMTNTLPAKEIPVKSLSQILVWPFVNTTEHWRDKAAKPVKMAGSSEPTETWFETITNLLHGSDWVSTDSTHLMEDGQFLGFYEEAVYFHDFIRKTLYETENDTKIYQRPGLRRMSFEIGGAMRDFNVPFNSLHVYESGVVILTLELVHDGPLTLNEAQTIIDQLRRAYPPFWYGAGSPGLSPKSCKIIEQKTGATRTCEGTEEWLGLGPLQSRETATKSLRANGLHEPMFPWWQHILAPLTTQGDAENTDTPAHLRQVLDERIPLITTLSLTQKDDAGPKALSAISDGDWYRLAIADSEGESPYPYNPGFLAEQRDNLFYDRFFPFEGDKGNLATRFVFAGYHFGAIGAGQFFDDLITEHTRRHYRHMQHVCLLEFATLLGISQDLCQAVDERNKKRLAGEDDPKFGAKIIETQSSFMDFTHKYHFTGVSNQLQAREMFDKMRSSMELDARYAEIRAELASATELALAEEQRATTKAAQGLTEIATVAAVIGVAAAILGMNVVFGGLSWIEDLETKVEFPSSLAIHAFIFSLLLCVVSYLARKLFRNRLHGEVKKDLSAICRFSAVSAVFSAAVAIVWLFI